MWFALVAGHGPGGPPVMDENRVFHHVVRLSSRALVVSGQKGQRMVTVVVAGA